MTDTTTKATPRQTNVTLTPALRERLDAYAAQHHTDDRLGRVNRSAAVESLLTTALDAREGK